MDINEVQDNLTENNCEIENEKQRKIKERYDKKKQYMREYSKSKYREMTENKNSEEYKKYLEYYKNIRREKSKIKKQEKLDFMEFMKEKRRQESLNIQTY
jgi:hypothetical protein